LLLTKAIGGRTGCGLGQASQQVVVVRVEGGRNGCFHGLASEKIRRAGISPQRGASVQRRADRCGQGRERACGGGDYCAQIGEA
ncbi:hypothetical protein ACNRC9_08410, partial [Ralstonia pseudosolanacearum]|uniref:hypothetical protein n=1 Tax=Ralstonia pseudosolanacearum TaxID=1310165 RepID=UPI003AACCFCA